MSHNITPDLPSHSDHVVGVHDGVELPVRVFPHPDNESNPQKRPWALWVHGGAFLCGQHFSPLAWVLPGFHSLGYHVVSIGYRLMPHARYEEIVSDCIGGQQWALDNLPSIVGESNVDSEHFALSGSSAGGTLVLIMGDKVKVKPRAIICVYGLTDFTDPYHYDTTPVLPSDIGPGLSGRYPESEIAAEWDKRDLTKALTFVPVNAAVSQEELQKGWQTAEPVLDDRHLRAIDVKLWIRARKRMLSELCRRSDFKTDEDYWAFIEKVNPINNVKPGFPPTFIIHGEADQLVPVEESRALGRKFKEAGVDHEEIYVPNAGHVFDKIFTVRAFC